MGVISGWEWALCSSPALLGTLLGWGQDPPFERPGFPAMVLPWCLGSAWSLCHSPWDTHCPSRVPKGLSVPLLSPSFCTSRLFPSPGIHYL